MAKLLFYTFPILAALAACSTNDSPQKAVAATHAAQQAAQAKLRIPVSDPILIDSSDYVMYPLSLSETVTENESEYGSSYGRATTYWNILFYNPKSNESHLLAAQKLFIASYAGQESSSASGSGALGKGYLRVSAADKLLYFSIVTTDFNHDGQLTTDDPTYLFVSDKAGKNFQQISPDSLHVTNWEIQRNTGKILLQARQDSNHDHRFGEGDEVIPYVYDIAAKQPARRVFSPALMQQLSTRFQQQWFEKP